VIKAQVVGGRTFYKHYLSDANLNCQPNLPIKIEIILIVVADVECHVIQLRQMIFRNEQQNFAIERQQNTN
jgi:hypothetical protein